MVKSIEKLTRFRPDSRFNSGATSIWQNQNPKRKPGKSLTKPITWLTQLALPTLSDNLHSFRTP